MIMNTPNKQAEKIGNLELNKVYCMDALELLKQIPDKSVDLVLTDPPYGINMTSDGFGGSKNADKTEYVEIDNWDNKSPSIEYFNELLRVGKKVIIFGGNYFLDKLPKGYFHVWDKRCGITPERTYADGEIIWFNFREPLRIFRFLWDGFIQDKKNKIKDKREHPTQKPVLLIQELISKYSESNDIVLDCFIGSGTTAVACKQLGRNFIGCDNCQEYVNIANKRLEQSIL